MAEVVGPVMVVGGRRLCKGAMEGRRFHYYELMRKVSRTKIEEASWHVTQFCGITKLHSSSFTLCPFWHGVLFLCFAGPRGCQSVQDGGCCGYGGGGATLFDLIFLKLLSGIRSLLVWGLRSSWVVFSRGRCHD